MQKRRVRRKKWGQASSSSYNIITLARLKAGLSQTEVAKGTHCSQSFVSKVERGKVPDVIFLYRVAELFEIPSPGAFFEEYVQETLNRIQAFVKTAPTKHQSSSPKEENTGEPFSSSTSSETPTGSAHERLDLDSHSATT